VFSRTGVALGPVFLYGRGLGAAGVRLRHGFRGVCKRLRNGVVTMWILLALLAVDPGIDAESLMPARVNLGEVKYFGGEVDAPYAASAKSVVWTPPETDLATPEDWYQYMRYWLEQPTPYGNQAYYGRGAWMGNGISDGHEVRTRWLAHSGGAVSFEVYSALDPFALEMAGNPTRAELDAAYPWLNADVDGNEISQAVHSGKAVRYGRWLRYTRTAAGVEKYEWWQIWRRVALVSGDAAAYAGYLEATTRYMEGEYGWYGNSPNVLQTVTTTGVPWWSFMADPSPFIVNGQYPPITMRFYAEAYYGSSSTLGGVDRDLLDFLRRMYTRELNMLKAANNNNQYFWEHYRDAGKSQAYWWYTAGANGYWNIEPAADMMGDLLGAQLAAFGAADKPISWTEIQTWKQMAAPERPLYMENLSPMDQDGDGWSDDFERKHGYSYENFFDKPGDLDLDGWLDTLDCDIDGDGLRNSEDDDDDGDGRTDVQEATQGYAAYNWHSPSFKVRPVFVEELDGVARASSTVYRNNELSRGVMTYGEWLDQVYDEETPYLFRWDDVHPDGLGGIPTAWTPQLPPFEQVTLGERDGPGTALGWTFTRSPEAVEPVHIPYRGKDPDDYSNEWGPGWDLAPEGEGGESGYDGWGEDYGDWYAPPHKLGGSGSGLEDLTGEPDDMELPNPYEVVEGMEGVLVDGMNEIQGLEWIKTIAPLTDSYLDYQGTFYLPVLWEDYYFTFSLLPDPNTPWGAVMEDYRATFRQFMACIFYILFLRSFWGVVVLVNGMAGSFVND